MCRGGRRRRERRCILITFIIVNFFIIANIFIIVNFGSNFYIIVVVSSIQ